MFLKNLVRKIKSANDETEEIDNKYFAEVMDEIDRGFKDKGIKGKAIAISGGDDKKANALYIQMRAEFLQEKAYSVHILSLQQKKKDEESRIIQKNKNVHTKDELYQALIKLKNKGAWHFVELYKNELKEDGFTKAPWYSPFLLQKDGKIVVLRADPVDKTLILFSVDNDDIIVTYDLNIKASEIVERVK